MAEAPADASSKESKIPPLNPEDPLAGLTDAQVQESLATFGKNEIVIPETPLWKMFLKQFMGFLPVLIELAAIVSIAVQDYTDFGIILAMLVINAVLGFHEEYKAKKSLDELSHQLESEVAVRRNGETIQLNVKELVPGDVILLVGGTIVPADTKWIKGDTVSVDTAPLTGEPIPRKYPGEHGDVILSGTTVVAGECYGQVVRTGENTEIGNAQKEIMADKTVTVVSVFQKKIMLVVQILVSACFAMVIAVLLVEGLAYKGFTTNVPQTILDALVILIASIPIALPLVLQVNMALGASHLAKEYHAVVTSLPALQDIASMSMLCSDKTGTLTTANMSIITDQIYASDGFTPDEVILYGFLCSNADKKDDPIDRAIVNAFNDTGKSSDGYEQTEIIGFNPSVKRVVAFVKSGDKTLTIAKGLPAKILDTEAGAPDDHELQWKVDKIKDKAFLKGVEETDTHLSTNGYKTIAIAVCEGNARELGDAAVWKFAGLLPMLDPPREDTPATIESLHHANISVKMITGDHANVGKETSRLIGLGTNVRPGEEMRNAPTEEKNELIWNADGFAAVLPSDKREIVMVLRNHYGVVTGMTGDGVNDAAALSAAQVGIAVEGATDAAKNAADLILTEPGLSPIYGAVLESRRIFARIKSYVVYRVAASLILVLTLSIVIFVTSCAVDSLMIIILALLNDVSMIPVAYDNAKATTKPQLPVAKNLVLQSLFYGLIQAGLSLMFIFCMNADTELAVPIDLGNPTNTCQGEARGFIWFHLVLVTELMIFSVRAPGFVLLSPPPSIYLLASVGGTCILGGLLAHFISMWQVSGSNIGWVILFNVGAFLVMDVLKIQFRKMIGEEPGEVIANDELIQPKARNDAQKTVEKGERYRVHRASIVGQSDRSHVVEVRQKTASGLPAFFNLGGDLLLNQGIVNSRRAFNAAAGRAGSVISEK
jgi:H+-transporting ATPase